MMGPPTWLVASHAVRRVPTVKEGRLEACGGSPCEADVLESGMFNRSAALKWFDSVAVPIRSLELEDHRMATCDDRGVR